MIRRAHVQAAVIAAIAEVTGRSVSSVSPRDDLLKDLSIDSMNSAAVLISVEEQLHLRLPHGAEIELVGARTVDDLSERLAAVFQAAE